MKKLTTMPDNAERHLAVLWRRIGRPLATLASAIFLAVVIIQGESWAIRQGPLLLTGSVVAVSASGGCIPDDSLDGGALPVAILH